MNQVNLRKMATERILDADALINAQRWPFAYYVAGYAVECGLKSCILQQMTITGGVFQDKKFAEGCFTHDFKALILKAGLLDKLNEEFKQSPVFVGFWGIVSAWDESSRYVEKTQSDAIDLFQAITEPTSGVMQWIKRYW